MVTPSENHMSNEYYQEQTHETINKTQMQNTTMEQTHLDDALPTNSRPAELHPTWSMSEMQRPTLVIVCVP